MSQGKLWPLLFLTFLIFCCRQKTKTTGDSDPVTIGGFIDIFPTLKTPVIFGDSTLSKIKKDSAIHAGVAEHFIPDSIYARYFGKGVHPKWYATGKVQVKNAETYLILKAIASVKKAMYLVCLDKDQHLTASMTLLQRDDQSDLTWEAGMDAKYTVSVTKRRPASEGKQIFRRAVYVYNDAGVFNLIMTEGNEEKPRPQSVLNPIDTFPGKHKFTGDYLQDKRNIVAIRDGKNNSVVRFFIHFEKDGGSCTGELKGEAKFISPSVARYSGVGDPCSVEFTFTPTLVKIKELEGCGNHRDIRCYFEGAYVHRQKKEKPSGKAPLRKKI